MYVIFSSTHKLIHIPSRRLCSAKDVQGGIDIVIQSRHTKSVYFIKMETSRPLLRGGALKVELFFKLLNYYAFSCFDFLFVTFVLGSFIRLFKLRPTLEQTFIV